MEKNDKFVLDYDGNEVDRVDGEEHICEEELMNRLKMQVRSDDGVWC